MARPILFTGLLLTALAIAPLPLRAQSTPAPNSVSPSQVQPARRARLMEQLNLTAEQKQRIVAIRDRYRPQLQPLKQQLHQERDQLQALKAQNADPSRMAQEEAKLDQLRLQARTLRRQMEAEIQAVLTPPQQQQLAQLRQNRRTLREPSGQ